MTVLIDEYLEQQYNNKAAVPGFADYLDSWKVRSELFRKNNKGFLDLSYGQSTRQVLDIFPLQNKQKAPVHIFIHGGYWQALNKDSFSFMAETFNGNGECAVFISYDLCPSVTIDIIIEQIKKMVLWIRDNIHLYGGDSKQVQISGHSAGAHLLTMLLTADWSKFGLDDYPFQRLNALSGIYDLQPLVKTSVNQGLGMDQQCALQHSPLFNDLWKPAKNIKLNLVVGELESEEYKKQSNQLLDCWQDKLSIHSHEATQIHHFSMPDYFLKSYPDYL